MNYGVKELSYGMAIKNSSFVIRKSSFPLPFFHLNFIGGQFAV
jgi:hypothetical protein